MTDVPDQSAEYQPVMPFVACITNGGSYDDAAFVAGYECGHLDAVLGATKGVAVVLHRWVTPALIPQLDLIAMKHEQRLVVGEESEDGEWRRVRIGHPLLLDDQEAS